MTFARKFLTFGLLLITGVLAVGALVWIYFGKEYGLAFSSVLNSLTAFCLLLVTTAYVVITAKILDTSAHNVWQQAELAEMMKKDLRARIAPYLRWRFLAGHPSNQPCVVVNEGPGIAIDMRGAVKYSSQVEFDLSLPLALALKQEHNLAVNSNNIEYIELTCYDSLKLARYTWHYHVNGELISYACVAQ